MWIKHEFDFTFYHMRKPRSQWLTIFPFFMILDEQLANFWVISREITTITGIRRELDFTIWNWSETWFREMLKIAFKHEFSVNVNSQTHHYFTTLMQCPQFHKIDNALGLNLLNVLFSHMYCSYFLSFSIIFTSGKKWYILHFMAWGLEIIAINWF